MTVDNHDAPAGATTFCAWCGEQLVTGARFCPGCGEATGVATPVSPSAGWVVDETDSDAEHLSSEVEDTLPLWESAAVEGEAEPARRFPTPSRRWMTVGAAAVALLLVMAAAGTWGYRYLQDRPVHEAFSAAQEVFSPMAESFAGASDLEQVGFAGQRAEKAVDALASRRSAIAAADTDLARKLVPLLDAQIAVAQAGALLAGVEGAELDVWGQAHEGLTTALEDVAAATEAVRAEDADSAKAVVDAQPMLRNLEDVVGAAVAQSVEASVRTLLADLAAARSTADVRAVAETATRELQAGEAATEGMAEDGDELVRLESSLTVYRAITGLSLLDGETLGDWPTMRQALTGALGSAPADSPLVADGRQATAGLNKLVTRAATKLSDWRSDYDAAVADKAADTAALEEYVATMQAAMRRYSTLRADLSGWVARVESPGSYVTYDEAYSVLSQAQWDRQSIRDEMNGLAVPDGVRDAHAQLVGVVGDAVAAMQAAYDGATDSDYCRTSCYYNDTPGWIRFSSESGRITEAYQAADENWQAAVATAKHNLESRKLPRKPQV